MRWDSLLRLIGVRRSASAPRARRSGGLFGPEQALSGWLKDQPLPHRDSAASATGLRRWLTAVSNSLWELSGELERFSTEIDLEKLARLPQESLRQELDGLQDRAAELRRQVLEFYEGILGADAALPASISLDRLLALEQGIGQRLRALAASLGTFEADWSSWQREAGEALARSAPPQPANWQLLGWLGSTGRVALILTLSAPLLLLPRLGPWLYGTLAFVASIYLLALREARWAACPICDELNGPFLSEGKVKICVHCRQPLLLRDERLYSLKGLEEDESLGNLSSDDGYYRPS